jgi:hypothetical protein
MKNGYNIYITDIESGNETPGITVFAFTSRDAIALAGKIRVFSDSRSREF